MFSERVLPSDLSDRLDAGFYRPDYLRSERFLRNRGAVPLRALVKGIACGPFGGNAIADELYADKGVAFVRPVNISSGIFDNSSLVRVPKDVLASNGLKVYTGANLYFGRVGVPCVALIDAETSISPNIIIARPDCAKADPYYLYAFSASRAGIDQLQRQLKEVAQPTTSTDSVKDLLILACHGTTQRYIGDQVRQAERLRAQANRLAVSARLLMESLIQGQISESQLIMAQQALDAGDISLDRALIAQIRTDGIGHIGEPRLVSVVRVPATLLDHRLDVRYNSPEAVTIRKRIRNLSIPTARLDSLLKLTCGPFGSTLTADEHDPNGDMLLVQPTNISGDYFDHTKSWRIRSADATDKGLKSYDPGTLLFARVGVYPHVGVLPHGIRRATISSSMIAGESLGKLDPHYAFSFFRSHSGYKLLLAAQKITAQPTIGTDEIGATTLVFPHQHAQKYIGDKVRQAEQRRFLANSLAISAKLLVESLIEGYLGESQLIAAQQALEAGDDSLDRALLERLKTDGIDGAGEPLFPDLGQLYDLVRRATQEAIADGV